MPHIPAWRTAITLLQEQAPLAKNEAIIEQIPRTIINCTSTMEHRNNPGSKMRHLTGERVWEIDTGHDLMITEPEKVASMLLEVASVMKAT